MATPLRITRFPYTPLFRSAETVGVTEEHKRHVVDLWRRQPALKSRVFAVASDIFVVPGPRVAEAAEAFEQMLHPRSEEHTSELQSQSKLVCRPLPEKKNPP